MLTERGCSREDPCGDDELVTPCGGGGAGALEEELIEADAPGGTAWGAVTIATEDEELLAPLVDEAGCPGAAACGGLALLGPAPSPAAWSPSTGVGKLPMGRSNKMPDAEAHHRFRCPTHSKINKTTARLLLHSRLALNQVAHRPSFTLLPLALKAWCTLQRDHTNSKCSAGPMEKSVKPSSLHESFDLAWGCWRSHGGRTVREVPGGGGACLMERGVPE